MNRIIEHDLTSGHTCVLIINHDPISFEMALFSYMSQLEEVDKHAHVTIYKDEYGIMVSSYRMNTDDITLSESNMSGSFLKYTLVNGDVEENYESLFDIDMPCNKTFKLVKDCNDLYIGKIYN